MSPPRSRSSAPRRAVTVAASRPVIGAVTLALLFGLFSMTYGVSEIVAGVQMRRTGKTLHLVRQDAA